MANFDYKKRYRVNQRPSWKEYQKELKKQRHQKYMFRSSIKYILIIFILFVAASRITDSSTNFPKILPVKTVIENPIRFFQKDEIRYLLEDDVFLNLDHKTIETVSDGQCYRVETTLDIPLQHYLLENLDTHSARYIGIVVMEPATGRILAMVSYNRSDEKQNACTENLYPAASVFKIITASAAVEKCGFTPDSKIGYLGNKYTLYKYQMRDPKHANLNWINLEDSFAQSVNPVFGKIGIKHLGKTTIEKYSQAFGFNRHFDFELPVNPSVIHITDEPYHWAEIASGFNRQTLISPLHGAMMTATVLNKGRLIEPMIVERVLDEKSRIVYSSHLNVVNRAVDPNSAETIREIMKATISSGTCRKAFRGYAKDEILSQLEIGGKTGSINTEAQDARNDWFVGYAAEKKGHKAIVISAVIVHEEYLGTQAREYARMVFSHFFKKHFENRLAETSKHHGGASGRM